MKAGAPGGGSVRVGACVRAARDGDGLTRFGDARARRKPGELGTLQAGRKPHRFGGFSSASQHQTDHSQSQEGIRLPANCNAGARWRLELSAWMDGPNNLPNVWCFMSGWSLDHFARCESTTPGMNRPTFSLNA